MQHSHLSACTIFTSLQFFVTPGRFHIYHITNALPVPYLLQSGIFLMPGWYCICSTPIYWPIPYLHHFNFLSLLAGPTCMVFPMPSLYHICFHQVCFNACPVLYMHPSHVSAHTIFTSLQSFVTPGQAHIYAITNAWPVPHFLPSGIFLMPGQYCICSTPICWPVPYLHHFHFLASLAGPISTLLQFLGLYHFCFPGVFFHSPPGTLSTALPLHRPVPYLHDVIFQLPVSPSSTGVPFASLNHSCILSWLLLGLLGIMVVLLPIHILASTDFANIIKCWPALLMQL